jgi:hypothetical protein
MHQQLLGEVFVRQGVGEASTAERKAEKASERQEKARKFRKGSERNAQLPDPLQPFQTADVHHSLPILSTSKGPSPLLTAPVTDGRAR